MIHRIIVICGLILILLVSAGGGCTPMSAQEEQPAYWPGDT